MNIPHGKVCTYSGVRFRSRAEARYALLMDMIGVRWTYEPSHARFTFPSGLEYQPDFFLHDQRVWLEVKGEGVRRDWLDKAIEKAACLAQFSGHSVFVAVNTLPRPDVNVADRWHMLHFPAGSNDAHMGAWSICLCCGKHFLYSSYAPQCPYCGRGHGDECWVADPLNWRYELDAAYRKVNAGWGLLQTLLQESA